MTILPKSLKFPLVASSGFILLLLLAVSVASAKTISVVTASAQCPGDTDATTKPCYVGLTDAITNAEAGDSIHIYPGTYVGNYTLSKSVSISGDETAGTVLSGGGAGTILTINNSTASMSIRHILFVNAGTGIHVSNSSSVGIANNIFQVGSSSTGVQTTASASTEIANNTFYLNSLGIVSDTAAPSILNNIFFLGGGTAISPSSMALTSIQNNLFYGGTIGPAVITIVTDVNWKGNLADQDPLFVDSTPADPASKDLHLRTGSPCINAGSTSRGNNLVGDTSKADMGAYGGPNTDTIPFPVSGVTSSMTSTTSALVSWSPNIDYAISGYHLYYGKAPGVYNGTESGTSPITIASGITSTTLSGLVTALVTPASPVLAQPSPIDQGLMLSWSAVDGATNYRVYYSTTSFSTSSLPGTFIDVGNTTTYPLTGLANGETYYIAVSAIAQSTYYIAITALYSGATHSPGIVNESAYSSEVALSIGETREGAPSAVVSDFPEALLAYPVLPKGSSGCFIATAAYGYYSAPQVQALRVFRDRYLMPTSWGRAFVAWYYEHGPKAAAYLNEHPGFKPLVRAALLPAVGTALFLTRTPFWLQLGLLLVAAVALYLRKRKPSATGAALKKTALFLALLTLLPVSAQAAADDMNTPHWSLEIKGGRFTPALENWAQYYGKSYMNEFAGALAYKVIRQVEVGVSGGTASAKGTATAPLHGTQAGDVTYDLYPVNAFVLLRGVMNEEQWIVPYIGGGWTRMYYRQQVEGEEQVRGHADGYHARGGLQFAIDGLDARAAHNMYSDYGVFHTYLFIEAEYTKVKLKESSVNLGGTAYLMGLLFEF